MEEATTTPNVQWARDLGVEIQGIVPKRFPGRGLGIAAEKDIQHNAELVRVPTSQILSLASIPQDHRARFRPVNTSVHESNKSDYSTVHAIISSFIAFHPASPISITSIEDHPQPWPSTWPTPLDFWSSLPMLWGNDARELLPPTVDGHVKKMQEKMERDWKDIEESGIISDYQRTRLETSSNSKADRLRIPLHPRKRFEYCWAIVNTRCFYYTLSTDFTNLLQNTAHEKANDKNTEAGTPDSTPSPPSPIPDGLSRPFPNNDDNMALLPFLDLFNHVSTHPLDQSVSIPCDATYTPTHYVFKTPKFSSTGSVRLPEAGQEVYTSYGPHPQDFLFSEYGFTLSRHTNTDDNLSLTPLILPYLSTSEKDELETWGFLGDYSLYPNHKKRYNDEHNLTEDPSEVAEVCFRTQVVAVLVAGRSASTSKKASAPAWIAFLSGNIDLDHPSHAEIREESNGVILSYIQRYHELAVKAIEVLESFTTSSDDVLTSTLGPSNEEVETLGLGYKSGSANADRLDKNRRQEEEKRECARIRYDMLRWRWNEIKEICEMASKRKDWF